MTPQESELSGEDKQNIAAYIERGIELLGSVGENKDPKSVVYAINEKVRNDRERVSKLPEEDYAEFILAMACLWGEQVCKQYGWMWTILSYDGADGGWAIVAPDRSAAVFPLYFI